MSLTAGIITFPFYYPKVKYVYNEYSIKFCKKIEPYLNPDSQFNKLIQVYLSKMAVKVIDDKNLKAQTIQLATNVLQE